MMPTKAEYILDHGKSLWLGNINGFNGSAWLAKYKGKLYYIEDDGTGNGYYGGGKCIEVDKIEAFKRACRFNNYKAVLNELKEFGVELSQEDVEKALGI